MFRQRDDAHDLLVMINQSRQRDAKGIAMQIADRFVGAKILWGRPVKIRSFPTREAAEAYAQDTTAG